MTNRSVVAIIPAFNEEKTIADVVRPLVASPLIDHVLVVSDGSTDRTKTFAEEAGATVYQFSQTQGKGQAMRYGVMHTQQPILVFLDADLIGLTTDHVERLLLPVLTGSRAMNVGIRDRGAFCTWLSHHLPLISGERAMERRVFENIPEEFLNGFMVETSLNFYCRSHKLPYGAVTMPGLHIRRKFEKVSFWLAVIQYIHMYWQVAQAILSIRLARFFNRF
ncbi:MAG: glycosyltransferase [Patescibacteria group bacterium]